MYEGNNQAIFQLLAEGQLLPPDRLPEAEALIRDHPQQSLATQVLDRGWLGRSILLQAVAGHLGYALIHELPDELPEALRGSIPAALCRSHGVVPLWVDSGVLGLGAVDPFVPTLAQDIAFILDGPVQLLVADPQRLQRLLRRHFPGEGTAAWTEPGSQAGQGDSPEPDLAQLAAQAPIVRFVGDVLEQAVREGASDVHFEPFETDFRVRCRVDGVLRDRAAPPPKLAVPILSRLKVLANLNIAERRLPQDGRLRLTVDNREVDLRIATLPTQFGESAVLRVLDQAATHLALGELGLPVTLLASLQETIHRPNGLFVVTGPTGSGKTTTLYGCLQELNTPGSKLLTVEDPVEYEIGGVMQVSVNPAVGLDFAQAMRTFLRQDPDVVMVGEIRDPETARIAIQAALTGHLVLTTLHTNDAPSAITRLLDLGVEPFLLASTLEAVLAQRLVRRLCPECRQAYAPDEAQWRQLAPGRMPRRGESFFRPAGCRACQHTGYRGRLGLFEFMPGSESLREQVTACAALGAIREMALAHGMIPLREAGIAAILAGETTLEEVLKHT